MIRQDHLGRLAPSGAGVLPDGRNLKSFRHIDAMLRDVVPEGVSIAEEVAAALTDITGDYHDLRTGTNL